MTYSLSLAVFLLLAMSVAGLVHIAWLRSVQTGVLLMPVDLGANYRGRRVFGDHKRLRGFIALPIAAAGAFALTAAFREHLPGPLADNLWDMSIQRYAWTGFAAGLGFMLAELPNSFLKRQLGVAPGRLPTTGLARIVCPLLDRFDSALGVLIAVSLLVPVPALTWLWVLLMGPGLHALFSIFLFWLGVKERAL
ncbi:MAG: CDP-archaeol synthase [Gammaproteobacteria bacterium]|nr:CDP-archaeol synthase [Gammaproteobacteria bacterium]MDH4313423.1 CDP-archaeol synthase [Gammaproteobacteria bacterium]MDH5214056.1 CDP-archaeol synthase [Gammaproteobacteria bacterium]MDH5501030.1 CDP-archaeol synthase [Gammaproteobacteria bacterium]